MKSKPLIQDGAEILQWTHEALIDDKSGKYYLFAIVLQDTDSLNLAIVEVGTQPPQYYDGERYISNLTPASIENKILFGLLVHRATGEPGVPVPVFVRPGDRPKQSVKRKIAKQKRFEPQTYARKNPGASKSQQAPIGSTQRSLMHNKKQKQLTSQLSRDTPPSQSEQANVGQEGLRGHSTRPSLAQSADR